MSARERRRAVDDPFELFFGGGRMRDELQPGHRLRQPAAGAHRGAGQVAVHGHQHHAHAGGAGGRGRRRAGDFID